MGTNANKALHRLLVDKNGNTIGAGGGSTPLTVNTTMTTANTEYSVTLPTATKGFVSKLRASGIGFKLNIGETASLSGTTYTTIPAGSSWTSNGISTDASVKLYFQAATASMVMETIYWT